MPPRPTDAAAEARTARQLRHLEELAEFGMALARVAAEAALHPQAADDTPPETPAARPPPAFRGDPGLVFVRLAHSVRQTIALEVRIVAGYHAPGRPPSRPSPPPPDPRRAQLARALQDGAPDRMAATGFRREAEERIEEELAADPEGQIPVHDILIEICGDLGVRLDWSRVQDAVLDFSAVAPEDAPGPPAADPSRPPGPDPP